VPPQWVFGLYDTTSKLGHIELVDDRSAQTLLPIIQRFIQPRSTIYSDQWPAYAQLRNMRYRHMTVNHSQNFVNPATGTWGLLEQSEEKYSTALVVWSWSVAFENWRIPAARSSSDEDIPCGIWRNTTPYVCQVVLLIDNLLWLCGQCSVPLYICWCSLFNVYVTSRHISVWWCEVMVSSCYSNNCLI